MLCEKIRKFRVDLCLASNFNIETGYFKILLFMPFFLLFLSLLGIITSNVKNTKSHVGTSFFVWVLLGVEMGI